MAILPFGFNENGIDEEQAAVVRLIFKEYKKVKSLNAIATMLNDRFDTRHNKNKWHHSTIEYILRNMKYRGTLVSESLFDEVNLLLNKKSVGQRVKHKFSGILFCSVCGGKYYARVKRINGKEYKSYRCQNRRDKTCSNKDVTENAINIQLDLDSDLTIDEVRDMFEQIEVNDGIVRVIK